MTRLHLSGIAAGLALALCSAGVVLAVGSSAPPDEAHDARLVPRSQPSEVQPALARRFGVLRRERRASDELPLSAARLVNDRDIPNTSGSNGGLARDSGAGPDGIRVFVAPGNDSVCLAVDGPGTAGGDIAMGGCADLEIAESGRWTQSASGGPFSGADETLAYGLVPDGVKGVLVENGAGEQRRVPVSGNVWAVRIQDEQPVTVRFGDVEAEVP